MCRNIKRLRRPEGAPTDPELHDAALQFIRKISGYRVPSLANRDAFDTAVHDVAASARRMFDTLRPPPASARRTRGPSPEATITTGSVASRGTTPRPVSAGVAHEVPIGVARTRPARSDARRR